MKNNPLFNQFNTTICFNNLKHEHVEEATSLIITETKEKLNQIITSETLTFESIMRGLDDLYHQLSLVVYPVYLMSSVHPDEKMRNVCDAAVAELSKFQNELNLNEDLYKKVKAFSQTDEAKQLNGAHKKFTEETVRDFERNGFSLSKEKRDELKQIQNTLSDLSIQFHTHIAEAKDFIILNEEETLGLPEDYKASHKQTDGTYKITLDYPSYVPFMKYSESDDLRKQLYTKYLNRAADKNLDVLKSILVERNKLATLLGYKTFAAYQVENRMTKTPETIWAFENELSKKVKQKAEMDFNELLDIKKTFNSEQPDKINPWEKGFYNNILLKKKYQLNNEEVKEYFELNASVNGLFSIAQKLFDVSFKEVESPNVWHEDVRLFEVFKNNKVSGRFYIDLHPREGKYSHAACFGIVEGKQLPEGYQIPTAGLVCNFPKATAERPALLLHDDVVTLFHEFGHVLHSILTESELGAYSGTSVARDFVETPSQMFENWAWSYESLCLFATHYQTNEVLPKELHEKMIAAKNVGSGLDTQQQIFYGLIDMTLHDGYNPETDASTTELIYQLQKEHTYFHPLKGTHFEASFGHLDGYAAGYYGYLWSKVYAEDFFGEFEEKGILNSDVGKRYRDIILASGGSKDPFELVHEFLQREPNNRAFLKSLGV